MGLVSQPLWTLSGSRSPAAEGRLRRLAPTLSDFFFVALLVWLFAGGQAGWVGLLVDGDTGWHIRTGEYVLDHGRVPAQDLFSFSKPGAPWFAWEWLADVALALLYRLAGFKAVVLAAALVITSAAYVVFRTMLWRGANPLVALGLCLLGVGASSVHYLARPHIFTLLGMAVSVWLVARDRERPTRWVWVLIPLTALWTNLHGGFVALIATVGLAAAGTAAEALLETGQRAARWAAARRLALLAAGCAAASLANPFGYRLHAHVLAYLKSDWIRQAVQEFQSPSFREESMLQFEILLVLGLFTAAAALRRRAVVEALWVVFWAHCALGSVRHVPLFVVVAAPLAAAEVSRWWERAVAGLSRQSVPAILHSLGQDSAEGFRRLTVWAAVPLAALAFLPGLATWPVNFPKEKFPVELVERHRERLAAGRVFTSDQWADYLIFRSYPAQRVFFDGRSDFYGPDLGREYIRLSQAHYEWEQLLDRHGFDLVLSPADWPLASVLKREPRWRILADDGRGILFERVRGAAGSKADAEKSRVAGPNEIAPSSRKY
ncbi:MAG: hypothetical protein HY822_02220 [Acidobacteria bacterium]|nr:hypothetical protein [Acidobacteriota bacterium]